MEGYTMLSVTGERKPGALKLILVESHMMGAEEDSDD